MDSSASAEPSTEAELVRFRWSVDHAAINEDGALLIFGWAIHDTQEIETLRALLKFADGSKQEFLAVYGTERADVARLVGDNPRALSSGYYVFGQAQSTDIVSLSLDAVLADDAHAELPTNSSFTMPRTEVPQSARAHRATVYRHLALRALRLVRDGRFRDLAMAARRYLQGRPRQADDGIAQLRRMAAQANGQLHLIIDHELGGGANQFRHSLVKTLVGCGVTVFILTFHVPTLRYVIECRRHTETMRLAVDVGDFLEALSDLKPCRVHWNNAVSFTRQIALVNALTLLMRRAAVPVTYYLHDYHSICPSHFLLDRRGEYCNVPGVDRCLRCLPEMRDGLVSLFAERDIRLWRRRWEAFLTQADEIVYFSEASLALLVRAYPQLARHRGLKFRPHDISDFASRPLPVDLQAPLNVGVVGRINVHKGARVVGQMAESIERTGAEARITVLGALDGVSGSRRVTITGSYERDQLSALLVRHKVNVVAFTSIWPETFSYVVAEVMSLGLPIVCFDLGAPAERVRHYRLGRVVPVGDGEALLEAAVALREDLLQTAVMPEFAAPEHKTAYGACRHNAPP